MGPSRAGEAIAVLVSGLLSTTNKSLNRTCVFQPPIHQWTPRWPKEGATDTLPAEDCKCLSHWCRCRPMSLLCSSAADPPTETWLVACGSWHHSARVCRPTLPFCPLASPLTFMLAESRAAIGGRMRGGGAHCCLERQNREAMEPRDSPCFFCWESSARRCSSSWQTAIRLTSEGTTSACTAIGCVWFLLLPVLAEPVCAWRPRWGHLPEHSSPRLSEHPPHHSERWLTEAREAEGEEVKQTGPFLGFHWVKVPGNWYLPSTTFLKAPQHRVNKQIKRFYKVMWKQCRPLTGGHWRMVTQSLMCSMYRISCMATNCFNPCCRPVQLRSQHVVSLDIHSDASGAVGPPGQDQRVISEVKLSSRGEGDITNSVEQHCEIVSRLKRLQHTAHDSCYNWVTMSHCDWGQSRWKGLANQMRGYHGKFRARKTSDLSGWYNKNHLSVAQESLYVLKAVH